MGAVRRPERARKEERRRRADKNAKRRRAASTPAKPALAAELEKAEAPKAEDAPLVPAQVSELKAAREKVRRWDQKQQGWLYTMPLTHEVVARREATETYMVLDRQALRKEVLAYEEAAPC